MTTTAPPIAGAIPENDLPQKGEAPVFLIRLMFADARMNVVTPIGGAVWDSQHEQELAWAVIPTLPADCHSAFHADLLDENGDILEDKPVSAETCEALMGQPIAALIDEGRRYTRYTLGGYKEKHPEMFHGRLNPE